MTKAKKEVTDELRELENISRALSILENKMIDSDIGHINKFDRLLKKQLEHAQLFIKFYDEYTTNEVKRNRSIFKKIKGWFK